MKEAVGAQKQGHGECVWQEKKWRQQHNIQGYHSPIWRLYLSSLPLPLHSWECQMVHPHLQDRCQALSWSTILQNQEIMRVILAKKEIAIKPMEPSRSGISAWTSLPDYQLDLWYLDNLCRCLHLLIELFLSFIHHLSIKVLLINGTVFRYWLYQYRQHWERL